MPDVFNRKAVAAGLGLLLTTIVAVWLYSAQSALSQLPDIDLQLIDGRMLRLSELQNKAVVITFWATTCSICIAKTPELAALYRKFQPGGLQLIAVAMSYDPPNRILDFSRSRQLPYPVALDLDGAAAKAFNNVSVTPTTFLVDASGRIILNKSGNLNIQELSEKIAVMLAGQASSAVVESS